MDTRRMILTIIFSVSLLMLWDNYQRSIGQPTLFGLSTATQSAAKPESGAASAPADVPSAAVAPPADAKAGAAGAAGTPATAVAGTASDTAATSAKVAELIEFKTDVLTLKISTEGAQIRQASLTEHPLPSPQQGPMRLLDNSQQRTYWVQTGFLGSPLLANHRQIYELKPGNHTVLKDGETTLRLEFMSRRSGVESKIIYVLHRGRYDIDVIHEVNNGSESPIEPSIYAQIMRDDGAPEGESSFYSTFTGPAVFSNEGKYQKIDFSSIAKNSASFVKNASDGWVAMVQHYFVTALIPADGSARENFARKVDNRLYSIGFVSNLGSVVPGSTSTRTSRLFVGPQDQHLLESMAPGLDLVRDYGWLTIIAKPLFWLLEQLHALAGNWGWAIVLLTILVKLAFFPLSAASYKSMAKMRTLTPRLTRLREQYGDDRMRLNQAMMELYKTEKINPLGGCLPVLVQIPVFLALYWVLLASVEMRNAPWIGWIHDLASPDPFYVLPIIMAASMFVQTKLNPTPPDPIQAKVMMMMPIVFSVMFLFFPSGLVLYWVVNNILSIAQQWSITRMIEANPQKA